MVDERSERLTEELVADVHGEEGGSSDGVEDGHARAVHEDHEDGRQELGVSELKQKVALRVYVLVVFLQ